MCGIFGLLCEAGKRQSKTELEAVVAKANALQVHRGPDGQGCFIDEENSVALGHARLSIIDLAGGSQPISNEDGDIHVVVNGELYGHEQIRQRLMASGHTFKTLSDSEIALHLYEEEGVSFTRHLRGEFALLLWDARRKVLVAVRDRFGIKPLFYTRIPGVGLVLSSEIKGFLSIPQWKAKWDVHSMLTSGFIADQRTCFQDVYKLPPGHLMLATAYSVQIQRYWDVEYPDHEEPEVRTLEEMVAGLRERIIESVSLRLQADVPVGVYLSGGIDSATCLGVASTLLKEKGQRVKSFSISFVDDPNMDEGSIAERMALWADSEFHKLSVTEQDMVDHFEDAIFHGEMPIINLNSVSKFMLSQFTRDHGIRVVLTGEGSDEIFAGYTFFLRDYLRAPCLSFPDPQLSEERRKAELVAQEASLELTTAGTVASRTVLATYQRTSELELASKVVSGLSVVMAFQPWRLPTWAYAFPAEEGCLAAASGLDGFAREQMFTKWHPLHSSLYTWTKTRLPNLLLVMFGDRMEMAHSVEGRTPFLDHHLAEYVSKLPPSVKIRYRASSSPVEKFILREAAKPFLTDELYRREKHMFMAPMSKLENRSSALEGYVRRKLTRENLGRVPFLDADAILKALDASTLERKHQLLIASFIVLAERFGVQK